VSWRVTGEKLVFDKTQPATIDRYNRSKLFLAWDGDPSILRSFRLPCWFEPYPHVINSSMQEQETYPTEGHSQGGLDSADEDGG
jgi:hypothetical protein